MNHKIERITKNQTSILVVLAAVAAVLVTGTAAVGTGHIALADNGNNTKAFKNAGISLPTDTKQKQECQGCWCSLSGHRLMHCPLHKCCY